MAQEAVAGSDKAPAWIATRLDQWFRISERGSSIRIEFLAALTTFATMSYVLAVHPIIMADAGMDRAQVLTVTALVAGCFSILMGLMANLPIAQAPGMGANALVAYTIILAMGVPWQAAMGMVFWSGVFFLILTVTGVRKLLLVAYPGPLKSALTAGIGLFIMFIGLRGAGILVRAPEPLFIMVGDITSPAVLLPLLGIPLVIGMMARKVPGAIILCITLLTIVGLFVPGERGSLTPLPQGVIARPADISSLWMALDIGYLWSNFPQAFPVLTSLVFMDLFSSLAAMNAMCQRADLVDENGDMLNPNQALSADALATIGASIAGTSTTNCFGESAAGIETGGRTGLVAIFVGLMFFLAVFINPLVIIIPPQATAPALVFIGLLMFTEVQSIDYSDTVSAGAAILTFILMAVTSIGDGMALGLLIYIAGMLLTGRAREVHMLAYILGVAFGAYYAFAI
ncbi:MAG: NCS2 family permease [Halieaceae bacterium]|nr:NCS2 family permease [Halieaceae bacterium]